MSSTHETPISYDVVVVGGGHNGLVCGSYLAKAGLKTLLLEAREDIGGCASTVSALGAQVNVCNCDHILFRSTNIAEELNLSDHGLSYLEVDPQNLALFWDKHEPWFLYKDIEATIQEISKHYPDQIEGYRRYCKTAIPIAELVIRAASNIPTFGRTLKALFPKYTKPILTLMKWQKMSAVEVLREFFSHEALILPALGLGPVVWGVDVGAKGTGLGALSYAFRHLIGIGRPQGGSGNLTQALRKSFESWGGEVRCNSRVEHIHLKNTSNTAEVHMVKLESGKEIHTKIAVAACDPRQIILNQLKNAPQNFTQKWQKSEQLSGYESKIDALVPDLPTYKKIPTKKIPADTGRSDLHPTAIIMPSSLAEIKEGYLASLSGQTPQRPIMLCNYPSVKDPTMATGSPSMGETSHHILSLEVLNTPYNLEGGWQKSEEPKRWLQLYSTLLEEPSFYESLSDWRCMTPKDYENDFNLAKGYAPSFTGSPVSALLSKQKELTRYKTSIQGLFFTGAGTFPGAGIWGASGRNAAQAILNQKF